MAKPIKQPSRNSLRASYICRTLNNSGAEFGNVAELLIEDALDAFDVYFPPRCDCGRELIVTMKCPVCDNDE